MFEKVSTNFLWSLFGRVLYAISQWCLVVIILKLGSIKILGLFGIVMGISSPIFAFANLNIRSLLATDFKKNNSLEDYYKTRLLTSIFGILLLIILTIFYDTSLMELMFVAAIVKLFDAISDLNQGVFQKVERLDKSAYSLIIATVLSVSISSLSLYYFKSLLLFLLSLALVKLIVIVVEFFMMSELGINISFKEVLRQPFLECRQKKIILSSVPLGITACLVSLNSNIPRYLIDKFLGASHLGVYVGIGYFLVGAAVITVAVKQAVISRLAELWHTNTDKFVSFVLTLCFLSVFVGFVAIVLSITFGDMVLKVIYDDSFVGNSNLVALMFSAATLMAVYSFVNASLTVMRVLKPQAFISMISIFLSFSVGVILIPKFGIIGAGVSVNIGSFVFSLSSVVIFYKNLQRTVTS
ncbi:MATE family efflux transporter [Halobacteriovorax marinus]|nr:oligosaccharide flippase family protein [Halobacteriovorax marinus]